MNIFIRVIGIVLGACVLVFAIFEVYPFMVPKSHNPGVLINLPKKLHFLIEPAMKFGKYQFSEDIRQFTSSITKEDRDELKRVADQLAASAAGDEINAFLDRYRMTEYPESANLFFLMDVVDEVVGIRSPPKNPSIEDQIADHIASMKLHGSYRLASGRMWAARLLADFGKAAEEAIPCLEQALSDDDIRVQIWAHVALACIHGNRKNHLESLRRIHNDYLSRAGDENVSIAITTEAAIERVERDGFE